MDVVLYQTHLDSVAALHRQRAEWLDRSRVAMAAMLDLERRLRVHVYLLSRCIDPEEQPPADGAAWFAYLAARLNAPDSDAVEAAIELACERLIEDDDSAAAARDALMLFLPEEQEAELLAALEQQPALLAPLAPVLAARDADLPDWLADPAYVVTLNSRDRAAVFRWAAGRPGLSARFFMAGLAGGDDLDDPREAEASTAALEGALVRGDSGARTELRERIERSEAASPSFGDLMLAALVGIPEVLPRLTAHLATEPEEPLRLLALHGGREAVDIIVAALEEPRYAEPAAAAWEWVSDQRLPRAARLRLVGEDSDSRKAGDRPEASPAKTRWKRERHALAEGDRWLEGDRLTTGRLLDRLSVEAGADAEDLLRMLALRLGRPLGIITAGWHDSRLRRLAALRREVGNPASDIEAGGRRRA